MNNMSAADIEELTRDPEKDFYGYYKNEIFKSLFSIESQTANKYSDDLEFCRILLNKIRQEDESSEEWFLDLAMALIKLRQKLKSAPKLDLLQDDLLTSAKKMVFSVFKSEQVEDIETPEMKSLNDALVTTKAALTKFLIKTRSDQTVINDFIKILRPDMQEAFQSFWGYSFSVSTSDNQIQETKTASNKSQKLFNQKSDVENPPPNAALEGAVKRVLEATQQLQATASSSKRSSFGKH
jgi:hypothetical protein